MSSGTTDIIYEYMNGALSKVKTYAENDNGTAYEEYNHTYDVFGNQLSVSVGNMALSTNTYAPNNGKLTSSTYGNGTSINYVYDNLDRIVSLRYNNNEQTAFNYTYNRFGSVSAITDTASGIAKIYDYDTVGRLISARTENGTNDVFRTHYTYDGLSRLDTLKYVYSTAAGTRYTHEYSATYGEDSRVNTFGLNGIFSITPTFDGLGRQSSRVLKNGSGAQVEKEDYAFLAGAGGNNATTTLIGSATYYGAGMTGTQYSYEYDANNNLTAIKKNGATLHTYTYDSLGQLTSWYNAATDKTVRYGYYKGGNLKNIYDWEDTVSFVYNNGDGIADRLMVYDGQLLSYDEIGNPLKFRDGISMTWKNGRQLATLTNGQTSASYDYDESGIRTKKTVNGVTTTFQLDGSKIVSENRNGTVQSYFYDENGSVLGITYGGENYYFRKNFRNDVLAILNASGEVVVEYSYNPWGNILAVTGSLASTLGADNPFRYRGYYYDTESCFYYLNSRYYDAKVCRFVNADDASTLTATPTGLTDKNLYSYCDNNPVMRKDDGGEFWHILVGAVVGAIVSGVAKAVENVIENKPWNDGLATSMLTGAACGALAATGAPVAVMAVGNAAISMAGNMADQIIENKGIDNFDVGEMVYEGVVGGVMGALGCPGTGTKNLMRQGINSVASTAKTFAREGVKAGVKKIGKAAAYYCGQTRYFYDALKRSIPADIMNSIVANTSKEHLKRLLKDIYS